MKCKECLHVAVCSRYIATGGTDNCKHFMPQKHGRWEVVCKNRRRCSNCRLERNTDTQKEWEHCPRCGYEMDLPRITDQTQAALEVMGKKVHREDCL